MELLLLMLFVNSAYGSVWPHQGTVIADVAGTANVVAGGATGTTTLVGPTSNSVSVVGPSRGHVTVVGPTEGDATIIGPSVGRTVVGHSVTGDDWSAHGGVATVDGAVDSIITTSSATAAAGHGFVVGGGVTGVGQGGGVIVGGQGGGSVVVGGQATTRSAGAVLGPILIGRVPTNSIICPPQYGIIKPSPILHPPIAVAGPASGNVQVSGPQAPATVIAGPSGTITTAGANSLPWVYKKQLYNAW